MPALTFQVLIRIFDGDEKVVGFTSWSVFADGEATQADREKMREIADRVRVEIERYALARVKP